MLHPIHTPLHCQHQANTAYDKLAVISDNMPKIQEVEQFIFELRQWLRAYLEGVKVDFEQALQDLLTSDNIWKGNNVYVKDITLRDGDIYWKDANGNNLAWVTYDAEHQILTFHAGNKEIQLSADGSIAPTTNPDLTTAIVTLDYLNQILAGYQPALTFDDTPTDDSTNPVTSDGIYEALQEVKDMISDELTIDDTVTEESENPVTSGGIYAFVTGLINAIPTSEAYVLPKASTTLLGGIKVGDYLTIDSNGVLSVDIDALVAVLGIGDTDTSGNSYDTFFSLETSWDTEYMNSTYLRSIGIKIPVAKSVSGSGNKYLYPSLLGAELGVVRTDTVYLDDTVKCKNTATQVTNQYVPVRYIVTWNSIQGGGGSGNATYGGLHLKVWFRNYSYTLTAEDKTTINQEGTTFLNDYTGIGHQDTGAFQ
jgi:hypothetical protein